MMLFLTNDSLSILEPCKNLRIFFGSPFTIKTIKAIL